MKIFHKMILPARVKKKKKKKKKIRKNNKKKIIKKYKFKIN